MHPKALFFLFSITWIFSSCGTGPESTLNKYVEAHNKHDLKTSLSLYDEEIVFDLGGIVLTGMDEIQHLEEWDTTLKSEIHFSIISTRSDTLFCIGWESNAWFTNLGISRIDFDQVIFVMHRGAIRYISAGMDSSSIQQVTEAFVPLIAWLSENYPNAVNQLLPEGQFEYNAANAAKWLKLIEEYKQSDSGMDDQQRLKIE